MDSGKPLGFKFVDDLGVRMVLGGECLVSSRKSHASYVSVLALGYGIVKMSKVQHQSILAHSALILSNNHSASCIVQYSPTTTRALDGRAWLI